MVKAAVVIALSLVLALLGCRRETEYYYADIHGLIKDSASHSGINNIIVDIYDYNPDNNMSGRLHGSDTTETRDGASGYYEISHVCYGSNRGILLIGVAVDSMKNPAYKSIKTLQPVANSVETMPDVYITRK